MNNLPKALTALAGIAFAVAVVAAFIGPIMNMPAHTFGHACTNLALLALAIHFTMGSPAAPAAK